MLTESDIDFMHASQDEILTHRERPVDVIYFEETRDPITGEIIGKQEQIREVSAVVTEISSGDERTMVGGVIVEQGDIKVDIKIELIEDIAKKLTRINYDGNDYEILASDKKGIGRRNRYEIVGRLIA